MSPFEFIFSLFGLLLGFSLVEVLGGLARALAVLLRPVEQRPAGFRLGWLTPLFALFVLLDLVSFWGAAWFARDVLSVRPGTLFGGLFFAGAYYLCAHLVFPPDIDAAGDLDRHYRRIHRTVLPGLLALLLLQLGFYAATPTLAPALTQPRPLIFTGVLIALMIAAIIVRSPRWSAVLLVALVVRYLVVLI
ncbi:hypothetical protein SAMN06297144_0364 [Sphingomonas guangdongensis]|uniref:Uncharacterized protein n=1 Tax=Sphingomonas guangdongensis TaxID=1141890 RepID=A0A285QB92_9SPHN|nr:hypothetical protein [Sphingomonas guangdongensis]SOB79081.1 hypothetical protein SAMN06297144_0364 [Sphingomonas guangdongensis]